MGAIRARLIAIVVGFVVGMPFVVALDPETQASVGSIVAAIVDNLWALLTLVVYPLVHGWIQKRANPTGAMTKEAANKLETVAHVAKPV